MLHTHTLHIHTRTQTTTSLFPTACSASSFYYHFSHLLDCFAWQIGESVAIRAFPFFLSISPFLLYPMNTQITTDTHERWSFVSVHCKLLISENFFLSISPSKPLPPPSWCTVRLKEAEQKYQCAICENQKPKSCSISFFFFKFLFISSFLFLLLWQLLSSLCTRRWKDKKFCLVFFVEVRTKANSHVQDTSF